MLYYDRIEVSKRIDFNKTSESKECDIYQTKGLSFKHMYAMDAMIY